MFVQILRVKELFHNVFFLGGHQLTHEKRIVLLGATGLLGQAYSRFFCSKRFECFGVARQNTKHQFDLTNFSKTLEFLDEIQPNVIINCAALTDLHECELKGHESWRLNAELVGVISEWSRQNAAQLIQISTDHFFDHGDDAPHGELDRVTLKNSYARQKFCAEQLALLCNRALVIRTSILGLRGWERKTFAEWALDVVNHQQVAALYTNVWTSSIDVDRFVKISLALAWDEEFSGVINVGTSSVYSKAEFVLALAAQKGVSLSNVTFQKIMDNSHLRATALGLDVSKVEKVTGLRMPHLSEVVASILEWEKKNEIRQ